MRTAYPAAVTMLGTVVVGILMPALAQSPPSMMPHGGMGMTRHEHGMSGGMMLGGCAGMMQSMTGGDQRPNSQWRASPPAGGSMLD